MIKFTKTAFTIIIIGSILLSACRNGNSNVDNALAALLNCNNYKSEWSYEKRVLTEGEVKDFDSNASIIIFHNPYRSKASSSFDPSQNNGIIFGDFYELKEGDNYKQKKIFKLESNDIKELELERPFNEEWLITQTKRSLLSEVFVEEQIIDGINVRKYKITITAYPFIFYFGLPNDTNNIKTRIFIDEYKECEGYIYVNSETNNIQRIEFDLSEKLVLNKKITERINKIGESITMPEYEKFKISIDISNINDNSKDVTNIEKEIDTIMK